jgi:hypothetical protein
VRAVDVGDRPGAPPDGPVLESWELAAVGPSWRPPPGEHSLEPVDGVLEIHADALVFRAREVVDMGTGAPLVAVIPVATMRAIGPLTPGTPVVGGWMPKWQRRLRSPGFAVDTAAGGWVFDGPEGPKRARELTDRFGVR